MTGAADPDALSVRSGHQGGTSAPLPATELPVGALFDEVVGQAAAVDQLRRAARRPVHAYLLVGPPGVGQQGLVRGFAAALLCPTGGCGVCSTCRRSLAGVHPDLVEVHRAGAALSVDDARRVVALAQRRPLEARRQVLVVSDLHLARVAAPVLLKTLEEPAGETVFVMLADLVPPELVTIASRCIRIDLPPVTSEALTGWLLDQGLAPDVAADIALAARGSVDRARLLVADEDVATRRTLWRDVPARLDGTGATAARLAAELLASAEQAVDPLRARHQAEMEELVAAAEATGERSVAGRKDIEDHFKREERRWRTDELKAGLGVLAAAYRDRLVTEVTAARPSGPGRMGERVRELSAAVGYVEGVCVEMVRNPNESLMLEALLVRLSAVAG